MEDREILIIMNFDIAFETSNCFRNVICVVSATEVFRYCEPYCLHTIFQKLHFSKSHFSETPQEKYDQVIFLQPKSRKKCCKNFENWFMNKIIMPKIILNRPFACAREVIQAP